MRENIISIYKRAVANKWLIISISIVAYIVICAVCIARPGLQYDEANFINTALGATNYNIFASHLIFGHNVLILPYLSALKSYIYVPIFKLFGVSIYSIRLPQILLTAIALFLLWLGLSKRVSKMAASLIIIILSLDATLIGLTKLDVGAVMIEFVCKCIVIYFLFSWLEKKRTLDLLGVLFFLAVGLINKLNFLWFINALLVSLVVVHWKDLKNIILVKAKKNKYKNIGLISIALIGYYLYYLVLSRHFKLSSSISFSALAANLKNWNQFIPQTIDGRFFYSYLFGNITSPLYSIYLYFIFALLITGLILFTRDLYKRKPVNKKTQQLYWLSLLIVVLTIGQALVTQQATAPWHYFAIYPFITIVIGLSIWRIYTAITLKQAILKKGFILTAVLAIIAYQMTMNVRYIAYSYQGKANTNWSPAIFSLINYTKATNTKFVSLNWGTDTQLAAFNNVPNKYYEAWQTLGNPITPAESAQFYNEFLQPGNSYQFITYFNQSKIAPNPTSSQAALRSYPFYNFLLVCNEHQLQAVQIKTISYRNQPIYSIYVVKK